MYKVTIAGILVIAMAVPASASKLPGSTTLKDSQPTGTIDKEHKHQTYDLYFHASGKQYTCRTNPGKSMKATDFVVGSDVNYQIDGNKAKSRLLRASRSNAKSFESRIVPSRNT
jgi:hypothetical protein